MAQFTERTFSAAPAPMMAAVLVWVVETGKPVSVAMSSDAVALMDAAKPWYLSRRTMLMPTVLMIFLPPTAVPMAMMPAQSTMIHRGNSTFAEPVARMMAIIAVDMNFWPS